MFVCFVLYYSDLFVFGLFSHCSSDACLLSNKRQMERRGWKKEMEGESQKSWGKENHNKNILHGKDVFSIKEKIKYKTQLLLP